MTDDCTCDNEGWRVDWNSPEDAAYDSSHDDFFQVGHTYTVDAPYRAPEDRPNFQCVALAIHPTKGDWRAFGFEQAGTGRPWLSVAFRNVEWANGWVATV